MARKIGEKEKRNKYLDLLVVQVRLGGDGADLAHPAAHQALLQHKFSFRLHEKCRCTRAHTHAHRRALHWRVPGRNENIQLSQIPQEQRH